MKAYIDQIVGEYALLVLGEEEHSARWIELERLKIHLGEVSEGMCINIDDESLPSLGGDYGLDKPVSRDLRIESDPSATQEMSKKAMEILRRLQRKRGKRNP